MNSPLEWSVILQSLPTLQAVEGGFTNAKRGIVTLPDGKRIFVKMGCDETTNKWARKEIAIYHSLSGAGYPYAPQLLSVSGDKTGFALELLDGQNGWEWETPWTEARLRATLEAMDMLARIPTSTFAPAILDFDQDDSTVNPWLMPQSTKESREALKVKLLNTGKSELADSLDDLRNSFSFASPVKRLVHYDVRRDNCAWNPKTEQVKLIDWNWLHVGSQEIDVNALMVNVYKSGLDPTGAFAKRLNRTALLWLCGYWLSSATKPGAHSMSHHAKLRAYQFDSALAAYDLAAKLR